MLKQPSIDGEGEIHRGWSDSQKMHMILGYVLLIWKELSLYFLNYQKLNISIPCFFNLSKTVICIICSNLGFKEWV